MERYWKLLSRPSIYCKFIHLELMGRYYNNTVASYFRIERTQKLIIRKYYWPTLQRNVELCVKDCNVCLASKTVRHKPHRNLQSLFIPTHWWKNLFINFVTGLLISTNQKTDSYNVILVIIDRLSKMVH